MDDDELLRALGKVAKDRDREARESTWEALLRGELTAEEVRELEALAEQDPEASEQLIAHRPIDDLRRERIVSELATHLAPARRRLAARAGLVASGLALTAALVVGVTKISGPDALPPYALDVSGIAETRGPSETKGPCVLHVTEKGAFEIVARADERDVGDVAAQAFVVRGGKVTMWPGAIDVAGGSVRILESTKLLEGSSELRIVIGRPKAVKDAPALASSPSGDASGRGWQVLRCTIVSR